MSSAVFRRFGLSVAAAAVLVFGAQALEVKGPVHITSRGVELISAEEWEMSAGRGPDIAQRDAERDARKAAAEGRRVAAAAAREAERAVREAAADARAAAALARADAREAAAEARAEARAAAAEARETARAAHRHARVAMRIALDALPVLKAGLRVEIHNALNDVTEARLDLVGSALQLAAVRAGDFSDVVIVSKGQMKCGDIAAHDGCAPLTDADKARLTETLGAALQAAASAMEAAQAGLAAAARAEAATP